MKSPSPLRLRGSSAWHCMHVDIKDRSNPFFLWDPFSSLSPFFVLLQETASVCSNVNVGIGAINCHCRDDKLLDLRLRWLPFPDTHMVCCSSELSLLALLLPMLLLRHECSDSLLLLQLSIRFSGREGWIWNSCGISFPLRNIRSAAAESGAKLTPNSSSIVVGKEKALLAMAWGRGSVVFLYVCVGRFRVWNELIGEEGSQWKMEITRFKGLTAFYEGDKEDGLEPQIHCFFFFIVKLIK